jgi:hypothetical protein
MIQVPKAPLIPGDAIFQSLEIGLLKGPISNINVSSASIPYINTNEIIVNNGITINESTISNLITVNTSFPGSYAVNKEYVDKSYQFIPEGSFGSIQTITNNSFIGPFGTDLSGSIGSYDTNEISTSKILWGVSTGTVSLISNSNSIYDLKLPSNAPLPDQLLTLSNNQLTWTSDVSVRTSSTFSSVIWTSSLNIFCAITNNYSTLSSNGLTWTSIAIVENNWNSLAWSESLSYFASVSPTTSSTVPGNEKLILSTDGINWQVSTGLNHATAKWISITNANDINAFGTCGNDYFAISNAYGLTNFPWTTVNIIGSWQSLCWSPLLSSFIIVGNTSDVLLISSISWNTLAPHVASMTSNIYTSFVYNWQSVCWSNELSIAVAVNTSNYIMTSCDGIVWYQSMIPYTNNISICWNPDLGLFCVSSLSGMIISSDGVNWNVINSFTKSIGVASYNNGFIGVGTGIIISTSNNLNSLVWTSNTQVPGGVDKTIQFKNLNYFTGDSCLIYDTDPVFFGDSLQTNDISCTTTTTIVNSNSLYTRSLELNHNVALSVSPSLSSTYFVSFQTSLPSSSSIINVNKTPSGPNSNVYLSYVTSTVMPQGALNSIQYYSSGSSGLTGSEDLTYIKANSLNVNSEIIQSIPLISPTTLFVSLSATTVLKLAVNGSSELYAIGNSTFYSMNTDPVPTTISVKTFSSNLIDFIVSNNNVYLITSSNFYSANIYGTTVGSLNSFSSASSISNSNNGLLLTQYSISNALIINSNDPINPTTIYDITITDSIKGLTYLQNIYIIDDHSLYLFQNDVIVNSVTFVNTLTTFIRSNEFLYVGSSGGVYKVNSLTLINIGLIITPSVRALYAIGRYLLIGYSNNIMIYDLDQSSSVSTITFNALVNDIQVIGSYAFIATNSGIYTINIYGNNLNSASFGTLCTSVVNTGNVNVEGANVMINNIITSKLYTNQITMLKKTINVINYGTVSLNTSAGIIKLTNPTFLSPGNSNNVVVNNSVVTSNSIILSCINKYIQGYPVVSVINKTNGSFTIKVTNIDLSVNCVGAITIGFLIV